MPGDAVTQLGSLGPDSVSTAGQTATSQRAGPRLTVADRLVLATEAGAGQRGTIRVTLHPPPAAPTVLRIGRALGMAAVTIAVQAAQRRVLPLQGLLAGGLAGAVVGMLARTWMRLITTDEPEFTWSGTIFIVSAFAVMGAVAGAVAGARRAGWRGHGLTALRVTGVVVVLPLATGAGIVLAPTLLLGAAAVGRTTWPAALRTVLAALAVVPVLAVHGQALSDGLGVGRTLGALLLCLLVYGGLVLALAQSVRPVPGGPVVPRRAVGLLLAGSAVLLAGLMAAGLPGLLVGVLLVGAAAVLPVARRTRAGR